MSGFEGVAGRIEGAVGGVDLGPVRRAISARRIEDAMDDLARMSSGALVAERRGPQGFRPDGRVVTTEDKREAFELYERLKAAHDAAVGAPVPAVPAVLNSMEIPPGRVCRYW